MINPEEDVWCMEWLIDLYQVEVVDRIINKALFLEEYDGISIKEMEDSIWKDYKRWAEERILTAKEALAENNEE